MSAAQPDANPFVLTPTARPLLALQEGEIASLQRRFQPRLESTESADLPPSQSLSIHVLRVAGPNGRFDDPELVDSRAIARTFLDDAFGESMYGQTPVLETRYGLRFLPQSVVKRLNGRASEIHDHQTLALLAELRIPLEQVVRVQGRAHNLGEVLSDAIANFYLDKRELAWTAMAFSAYLPPQRRWVNKFEQAFTFDDLVQGLLDEGFSRASCAGAHVLQALLMVQAADARFELLSASIRRRLEEAVHGASVRIVESQNPDGSWSLDWFGPASEEAGRVDDSDARFLATGHLGELSLYLPEKERLPDAVLKRAGEWILPELRTRIETRLGEQLCSVTHAFCFARGIAKNTGIDVETSAFRLPDAQKEQ